MPRLRLAAAIAALAGAILMPSACGAQTPERGPGLTAVEGLAVGHATLEERPTGCTVILVEGEGAVGGVDVRGGAPGTRELALLDPVNSVERVNAVVLSGGSAFGLDAAAGVVRWLEERDRGYRVGPNVIPIVVGAILYDLGIGGGSPRPGPGCGYRAAGAATTDAPGEGSVGAGAGATVGKLAGLDRAMKGGVGTASVTRDDGLTVSALVAVNAVGDVIDPATGRVVAGARADEGGFLDARTLLRRPPSAADPEEGEPALGSTTIGVVATNAGLTKAQATKMAQMAHDGLARAVVPAHTPSDGDTMFALATGRWEGEASLTEIGGLAAEVVSEAILRAVRSASGLPGFPSVSELDPPE